MNWGLAEERGSAGGRAGRGGASQGAAEGTACATHDSVCSGWNSGWHDGALGGDGLVGSESNPDLDGQPLEDSEGRLHISLVFNQIAQETVRGKEWKGNQLMNTPHPKDPRNREKTNTL